MDPTDRTSPAANSNEKLRKEEGKAEYNSSKGKFRFKSKSRSTHDAERRHRRSHKEDEHNNHHHHHKRHKKTKQARTPSPGVTTAAGSLSPNTAFRESLFDALGDDEGAAYWESVYGQPIHNYGAPEGPLGELESMTEEEYAAYVRARMWERTREGMQEEQERLRAEKAKRKKQDRQWEEKERERIRFERAMEESLARGQQRRKVKAWTSIWETYRSSWESIEKAVSAATAADSSADGSGGTSEGNKLRNMLFWPVESGKRRDISREKIEEFMRRAPLPSDSSADDGDGLRNLTATLKAERVRWHPDKIQHRYGVLGIDEPVKRSVTEVFQIIDHIWNEAKK